MQPDTIIPDLSNPQGWNRYSYVSNNPIRNIDPTGHKCVGDSGECFNNDGKTSGGFTGKPHKPGAKGGCGGNYAINCYGDPKHTITNDESVDESLKKEEPFSDLKFWINSYDWVQSGDEAVTFVINYGVPAYRQIRGIVPGGFWLEAALGALGQGLSDLENPNLTLGQRLGRAMIVGLEDGFTDSLSTLVAGFLAPLGAEIGAGAGAAFAAPETAGIGAVPGAIVGGAVGGGATFLAASYFTTKAMDYVFEEVINPGLFPSLFP